MIFILLHTDPFFKLFITGKKSQRALFFTFRFIHGPGIGSVFGLIDGADTADGPFSIRSVSAGYTLHIGPGPFVNAFFFRICIIIPAAFCVASLIFIQHFMPGAKCT